MSNNETGSPAEILILSAVKTVGKREFLKTVDRLFKTSEVKERRKKTQVADGTQCIARVKGERTGLKVGRYVLFDSCRCPRAEVGSGSQVCAIHKNQYDKFGELKYGLYNAALTEAQKKVFGDI
jgi:hypothetical protein